MKGLAALLLVVMLPFALAPAPRTPKSPADLYTFIQPSLVEIGYLTETEGKSYCAGFVVDAAKGWVLTAKHCVNPAPEGQTYIGADVRPVLRSDELFALLSIPVMKQPPLAIRAKRPAIGEAAVAVGYGFGLPTMISGIVAAFNDDDLALDVGLIPGMSGGPMVDAYGEVIGVNQRNVVLSGGVLGVGCGVEEIRAFLEKK